mgnify:CR=1 FL=1
MSTLQGTSTEGTNMESLLRENRVFPPPAEFAAKARIKSLEEYEAMYRRSVEEPEAFWAEAAGELEWFKPWDKVLDGEMGSAKWFTGGKLNLSHNCVDRHAMGALRDKVALVWEGEPGEIRKMRISEAYDYDLAGALIDSPETAAPGLRASPFPILAAPRGQTAPVAR